MKTFNSSKQRDHLERSEERFSIKEKVKEKYMLTILVYIFKKFQEKLVSVRRYKSGTKNNCLQRISTVLVKI